MNPNASPSCGLPAQPALSSASQTKRHVRPKSTDLHCAILEALMRGRSARATLRKKNITDEVRLAELRRARLTLEYALQEVRSSLETSNKSEGSTST